MKCSNDDMKVHCETLAEKVELDEAMIEIERRWRSKAVAGVVPGTTAHQPGPKDWRELMHLLERLGIEIDALKARVLALAKMREHRSMSAELLYGPPMKGESEEEYQARTTVYRGI